MKILHIIPSLRKGGAERLVLDICNEVINQQNIEVKLVTFSEENEYQFLKMGLVNSSFIFSDTQIPICNRS